MFRNYIKTAFRSLRKNIGFTIINVLGLALGLAICLLIVFYVVDELSYDRFNTNANLIYRINTDVKFAGNENSYAQSPAPTGAVFKATFPEVQEFARMRDKGGAFVKKGNQSIEETSMIYADPSLFSIFTIPFLSGDPKTALKDPRSLVITDEMATKYFGTLDVVGKTMTFDDSIPYKVTGVIAKMPVQSHFRYNFFISMVSLNESKETAWFSSNFSTYFLFRPGTDVKAMTAKLVDFMHKNAGPQLQSIMHIDFNTFERSGNYYRFSLTPLLDIHLHSQRVSELGNNGDIRYVYIFSAIAIFILLIACVNFMNLSTARSANRAKEVGVRKVLGSARKNLISQFLIESILITLISAVIAVFAAWVMLPVFNNMSGKELALSRDVLMWLIPVVALLVVVIGCLAGSYPAFFLSAFQPIAVLKGKMATGFKGSFLRSFLVVFQFSISIFLIIGTLVIYNQLNYIHNKDLGFNRDQVLIVQKVWQLGDHDKSFRQEVSQLGGVKDASLSGFLPTSDQGNSTSMFKTPTPDQKQAVLTQEWFVDEHYIPTLGIKMVSGRNFSKDMPTDTAALVVNEAAAVQLGIKTADNQSLYAPNDNMVKTMKQYHIVGIMKNFNYRSLHEQIRPLVLVYSDDRGAMTVRVSTTNLPATIDQIKAKWTSFSPKNEFTYTFMNEEFDRIYRAEERTGKICVSFTTLAILIACLGLFGLAAYAAEQRTKEIGIRKVLGANVSNIVQMLSRDFIVLVLVSILVAAPLAWWAMSKWLEGFAYRQDVQWWIVVAAGLGAIGIAMVTISFQSIKAALANPVKSLRSE